MDTGTKLRSCVGLVCGKMSRLAFTPRWSRAALAADEMGATKYELISRLVAELGDSKSRALVKDLLVQKNWSPRQIACGR